MYHIVFTKSAGFKKIEKVPNGAKVVENNNGKIYYINSLNLFKNYLSAEYYSRISYGNTGNAVVVLCNKIDFLFLWKLTIMTFEVINTNYIMEILYWYGMSI